MNVQKVPMKYLIQTEMKEQIQTNKKSVRIKKNADNVSMQVSSERAQVSESKSVSCQKELMKSVEVLQNQVMKIFHLCNDSKVMVMEKHREELEKSTHKW